MLDLSYFRNSGNVNTQTFTNAGSWVTWVKPRGAKFVNILCIGGGGGGAGGAVTGVTARGTGGGSGGAGGVVRAYYQASVLPDLLYVYIGAGGSGSLGSSTSTFNPAQNAEKSNICIIPDASSIANIVCTSGITSARGAAGNGGGAGETIATVAGAIFLNIASFTAIAGAAGVLGGAVSAGTSITPISITLAGCGGGAQVAGGGYVANGYFPAIPGPLAATGVTAPNGSNGPIITEPVLSFMGGTGGAGSTTTGGRGGDGSYGSGGGGGGGGGALGGNGGNGGSGIVIITTTTSF